MSSLMVKSGLVVGGGVLVVLAFVGYSRLIGPLPSWLAGQKGASSANDSPATAHGGSLSVHGSLDWKSDVAGTYYTVFYKANSAVTPNYFSIDGVDPNSTSSPASVADIKATGNWKIEFVFRDNSKLDVCSESDCALKSSALTTTFYLVGESNGTFTSQLIDRTSPSGAHGSIFYDPMGCSPTSGNPHPMCGHPKTVTVSAYVNGSATSTTYGPYHCVDGVCSIGIDHQ
jgi:hypothetical protein